MSSPHDRAASALPPVASRSTKSAERTRGEDAEANTAHRERVNAERQRLTVLLDAFSLSEVVVDYIDDRFER